MNVRHALACCAVLTMLGLVAVHSPALAQGDMDTPGIGSAPFGTSRSLLTITAGPSGAPAGFTVWWMKRADYIANNGEWFLYGDPRQGEAYFWGAPELNTNDGQYTTFLLGPYESITIEVGDLQDESGVTMTPAAEDLPYGGELRPGTEYVFCAYANGTAQIYQSAVTVTVESATTGLNCTFTQGYWKNHPESWPAGCLPMTLGANSYTQAELLAILGQSVQGNGAISLAHQLIAAKLNACQGAAPGAVQTCIDNADALLATCGTDKLKPVGGGPYCTLAPGSTSTLTQCLDNFNNGVTGPGHCGETEGRATSWGRLKSIYR
jgi:hypothetical protein